MGHMLQVLEFPYPSGLPGDKAEWTFNWETTGDPDGTDLAAVHTMVNDALLFESEAGHSLSAYLSEYIVRSAAKAWYFTVDTATGTMASVVPFGIDLDLDEPVVGTPLPLEVALCMTIGGSGEAPVRNRRGRVYIGPLQNAISEDPSDRRPEPSDNLIAAVRGFGDTLLAASSASTAPHVDWSVWSRVNHELYNIYAGYVDNEWDTQRRRGATATDRQVFPIV